MIFSSLVFLFFFAGVLLALSALKSNNSRKILLLAASWYFYAYWDWRFLSLILLSTLVDFWVGQQLSTARDPSIRKRLLGTSLMVNLGLLGYFKYCNFFIESIRPAVEALGFNAGTLDIILPVGISFYTFQTLSYSIDVYNRRMDAHDSLLDFALFVGFFPQLVAGPIVRAIDFLPQLRAFKPLTWANFYAGGQRFTYGLFKKVFLADRLAVFSDNVFVNAGAYDCTTTWLAAIAYSLQIYFDFSGYSDMAIGVARIMGYDLGENFKFPYLAKNPSEFWRRWHISLSSWVRDYIYIPLGGNRKGGLRTHVNLVGSMLLCGLWHGAAWSFVIWGGLHGLALSLHRIVSGRNGTEGVLWPFISWAMTMFFVVVGWVVFRAEGYDQAMLMYRQMFLPVEGVSWYYPFVPFVLAGMAIVYGLKVSGVWDGLLLPDKPKWYSPALLFSLIWLVIVFKPTGFQPFIYFQF